MAIFLHFILKKIRYMYENFFIYVVDLRYDN